MGASGWWCRVVLPVLPLSSFLHDPFHPPKKESLGTSTSTTQKGTTAPQAPAKKAATVHHGTHARTSRRRRWSPPPANNIIYQQPMHTVTHLPYHQFSIPSIPLLHLLHLVASRIGKQTQKWAGAAALVTKHRGRQQRTELSSLPLSSSPPLLPPPPPPAARAVGYFVFHT